MSLTHICRLSFINIISKSNNFANPHHDLVQDLQRIHYLNVSRLFAS